MLRRESTSSLLCLTCIKGPLTSKPRLTIKLDNLASEQIRTNVRTYVRTYVRSNLARQERNLIAEESFKDSSTYFPDASHLVRTYLFVRKYKSILSLPCLSVEGIIHGRADIPLLTLSLEAYKESRQIGST